MTTPASVRREATIVALALMTFSAYGASIYTYGVLIDDLVADLEGSEFLFVTAFGLAQILAGVGSIVAGRALDRHGSTPVYLTGLAGAIVLGVATLVPGPGSFVAVYTLGAGVLGATGFYHISQTAAARSARGAETGAITRLTVYAAFSAPLFIPLAGHLVERAGWRLALAVPAAVAAVSFLVALALAPVGPTLGERRLGLERSAFRGQAGRYAAALVLSGASIQILSVYQVPVMTAAGLSLATASSIAGYRGFAQFAGRVPLPPVVRRFGAATSMTAALAGIALGSVLLGLATGTVTAFVAMTIIGIAIGAQSPLVGIRGREVFEEELLGSALGTVTLGIFLAGAVGPVLAGLAVDLSGDRRAATFVGAATALAATGFLVTTRSSRQ